MAGGLSWTDENHDEFVGPNVRALTTTDEDLKRTVVTNGQDGYLNAPILGLVLRGEPWDEVATGWGRFDLGMVRHADVMGSVNLYTGPSGTGTA